jgi:uncharacterized protein YcgI (DUF1989 family)
VTDDVAVPATPAPAGLRLLSEVLIPAGEARCLRLRGGQVLQLIDVRGGQVSDVMAWSLADPEECFSPGHTVSCLGRLVPREGDAWFSNRRREMFRVRRDTVGRHDFVVPCCDPERYARDFGLTDHRSCLASIEAALAAAGEGWRPRGELAANVFMNNVIEAGGRVVTREPTQPPGAYLELEALVDAALAASSCPQDLTPCNAWRITEVAFRVFAPAP